MTEGTAGDLWRVTISVGPPTIVKWRCDVTCPDPERPFKMTRWTNDRWRPTLHRVVDPPGPSVRRQSMAYFQNANGHAGLRERSSASASDSGRARPAASSASGRHFTRPSAQVTNWSGSPDLASACAAYR
jgi:hypothetical protein